MSNQDLVEISNRCHDAIHEYIDQHGMNDILKLEMGMKIRWIKMIAERYGETLGLE